MQLLAKNITKTYGKKQNAFQALQGVSLRIEAGQSVAIIGKSGSGKSTLMHVLAALDRPTSGDLVFADKEVRDFKQGDLDRLRNHEFGFIFQQFFLNGRETVLENVLLPVLVCVNASVGR